MSKQTDLISWPTAKYPEEAHMLTRHPINLFPWMSIKENRHLRHYPCGKLFLAEELFSLHVDLPRVLIYMLMFPQPYSDNHIEKTLGMPAKDFHYLCVWMCDHGYCKPESRANAEYRIFNGHIGSLWFPLPTNTDFVAAMLRDAIFTQIMMVYHISAPAPLPASEHRHVLGSYQGIVEMYRDSVVMDLKYDSLFEYDGYMSDGIYLIKECS